MAVPLWHTFTTSWMNQPNHSIRWTEQQSPLSLSVQSTHTESSLLVSPKVLPLILQSCVTCWLQAYTMNLMFCRWHSNIAAMNFLNGPRRHATNSPHLSHSSTLWGQEHWLTLQSCSYYKDCWERYELKWNINTARNIIAHENSNIKMPYTKSAHWSIWASVDSGV